MCLILQFILNEFSPFYSKLILIIINILNFIIICLILQFILNE